jgi:hypothetical protein
VLDTSPAATQATGNQLEPLPRWPPAKHPIASAYALRAAAPWSLQRRPWPLRLSPEEAQAPSDDAGLVLFHEGDGVRAAAPEVAEDLRRRLTYCMRQRAADPALSA